MKQQTNRTLAACVAVFIGGAALAEDRATGAINIGEIFAGQRREVSAVGDRKR